MSEVEILRRSFVLGSLSAASMAAISSQAATRGRQPNIIFILADDMGWGDASVYGQRHVRTPNIDRLAAQGIRFTQGYAGAPVCGPSRCALMTGLHTGHGRIRDNFALAGGELGTKGAQTIRRASLTPADKTVAQYLQEAKYKTGLMGKWHLDGYDPKAGPTQFGFEEFKGWLISVAATGGYWPEKRMNNNEIVDIPENAGGKHGKYDTHMITDDSIDFIERHKGEPFFLYTAYDSPHSPYTAPDLGPYADKPWPEDEKTYAAMIHHMDVGIGKILAKIRALGLDNDTIIFFASDNGPRSEPNPYQTRMADFFDSNGGLTGYKRDMYEGGLRDPWIVRWSGHIKAGSVSDLPVYFPDFLPTALALAGAAAKPTDGINLAPYLADQGQKPADRFMYWEFYSPEFCQAARFGKWKAVRRTRGSRIELYDVSVDPWESKNLAAQNPDMIKFMEEGMAREHKASLEYPDPAPGTVSKPAPVF
jgi:arylsulfatase A-like enzyme